MKKEARAKLGREHGRRAHRLEPRGHARRKRAQRVAGDVDLPFREHELAALVGQRVGQVERLDLDVESSAHHAAFFYLCLSLNRWIFPVAVFGSSSTISTQRGYL